MRSNRTWMRTSDTFYRRTCKGLRQVFQSLLRHKITVFQVRQRRVNYQTLVVELHGHRQFFLALVLLTVLYSEFRRSRPHPCHTRPYPLRIRYCYPLAYLKQSTRAWVSYHDNHAHNLHIWPVDGTMLRLILL